MAIYSGIFPLKMVISHSYVSHYQRVIFRSDRNLADTVAPDQTGLENRGVIIKPRKRWKRCAFDLCSHLKIWLTSCVNLCESVWCSLCRCQLSFVHFPIFPALYGKCSRRSHWRMHVYLLKRRCMIGNIYWKPSGKIRFNLFSQRRSAGSWLHHRHAAMAMRWRWENHLLEVKIAMFR